MSNSGPHATVGTEGSRRAISWAALALLLVFVGEFSAQPAGAQPTATPQPSPIPSDSESLAITELLRQYRDAFASLDVSRVTPLWPRVDRKALERAFSRLEQQFFVFERCDISVQGRRAEARCAGNARVVPRIGGPSAQYRSGIWRFVLSKVGDRWVIQSVEATERPSTR